MHATIGSTLPGFPCIPSRHPGRAEREQVSAPVPGPRIWAVIGDKLGDNAQVRTVAQALPWPVEEKPQVFWPLFRKGKPWFLPSRYHIDRKRSATLAPPWPDLVLTIGRRPAMAALWIRRQSGGHTKVAIFGPPKGYEREFDLIIVPAQYRNPDDSKLVRLELPLIPVNFDAVDAAGAAWAARLAQLPRPLTAVLVGGATQPFVFDAEVAKAMLARIVAQTGGAGSLYFTTSRRTQPEAAAALQAARPASATLFRWQADTDAAANPYLGLLAHADRFVVTGDSVSMLVEVARLGKPLAIFPLPEHGFALRRDGGDKGRDITAIHRVLYARGAAVALGDDWLAPRARDPSLNGLEEVLARIQSLLGLKPDQTETLATMQRRAAARGSDSS